MSFYLYTDANRTQPIIISPCTADPVGVSVGVWNDMNNTKITDPNLGVIYQSSQHDPYLQWARSIRFTDAILIPAEQYASLYNTAGYKINFGITKIGEGQYSFSNCGAVYKPDSTLWVNGYNGNWTQTDPKGRKELKIALIGFSYTYGSETRHGYMFAPCYIQIRSVTPPDIILILTSGRRWLSDSFFSQSILEPTGGIPQQPEGGGGTFSAPSDTITPLTASELSIAMGGGGITAAGHGVHAYELTGANISEFLQKIYGAGQDTFSDLWQQFQNYQYDPMSGIIGALIVPCSPTGANVPAVTLSGQGIIISGGCKAITDRFASTNLCIIDCTAHYYDSFMDFEPYTHGTLYLPFIGTVSVNVNEFMYGYIEIYYTIDICTGNCVAFVTMRDKNNTYTQYTYSGNCGTPVPISGNDRGLSALISGTAGIFGGAVSLGAGIGLGNAGLAAKGVLGIASGAAQIGTRQEHEKHVGAFGGGCGCMGYLIPFLMLNRPVVSTPNDYTSLVGAMANQSGKVGDYSGYTEFDFVDLSGVSGATESEIAEIETTLKNGVWL